MNVFHKNDEERIVTGIALVATGPGGDRQQDVYGERAIESAVNSWSENGQKIYINHERPAPAGSVSVLQAFQSPAGYTLNGSYVPKGSFVVVLKIHSDSLWNKIKASGSEVGFSVGGRGNGESLGNGTQRINRMDITELSILLDGKRPAVAEARVLQMKSENNKMDLNSPEVVALLKEVEKIVDGLMLQQKQRELTEALAKAQAAAARPTRRYRTFDDYQASEYRRMVQRDAKDVSGIALRLAEPLENPAKPGTYFRQFSADLF